MAVHSGPVAQTRLVLRVSHELCAIHEHVGEETGPEKRDKSRLEVTLMLMYSSLMQLCVSDREMADTPLVALGTSSLTFSVSSATEPVWWWNQCQEGLT